MPNPGFLFYTDKNEASQYSHTPPGHLKVPRMLQNKSPWKKYGLSSEQKPRSLILADWTANQWSENKKNLVLEQIIKLLDDGFSIYLWQNGSCQRLGLDNVWDLDKFAVRKQMTPEYQEVIFKIAYEQLGLSHNQIQILDDYWLNVLLNQEGPIVSRSLSIKALLSNIDLTDKILAIVEQSTPPLKVIIADEFSIGANDLLAQLQEKFNPVKLDLKHDHLVLAGDLDLEACIGHSNVSKPILANIRSLEVVTSIDNETIQAKTLALLLKELSNLTKLEINNPYSLPGLVEEFVGDTNLPQLEDLSALDHNISANTLRSLLAKTTQLKKLQVRYFPELDKMLETLPQLRDIQELTIYGPHRTDDTIKPQTDLLSLLSHKKYLTRLHIQDCHLICHKPDQLHIDRLEELTLINISFSGLSALQLLEKKHCLKKLTLDQIIMADTVKSENIHIERLEELSLTNHQNSLDHGLQLMLSQAPQLKKLTLSNFQTLERLITMNINLPHLEEFEICSTSLNWSTMCFLLASTTGLQTLTIKECEGLDNDGEPVLPLNALKELTMKDSLFSTQNLVHLLQNNTCLKILRISMCGSIEVYSDLFFYTLEELNLGSETFNMNYTTELLAKNHNLKVLKLSDVDLRYDFNEYTVHFEHLEKLHLENMSLRECELTHLLASSKHLKKLTLESISIIDGDGDLIKSEVYLPELERLEVLYSDLCVDIIDALKAIAPLVKKPKIVGNFDDTEKLSAPNEHASITMDANTTDDPDEELKATRYFTPITPVSYDLSITLYRLRIFGHLEVNSRPCSLNEAFTLDNPNPANIVDYCPERVSSKQDLISNLPALDKPGSYILGQQPFKLTKHWQPIASLSPNEQLVRIYLSPMKIDIEIGYSSRDNLYYIKSKKSHDITMSFVLAVPDSELDSINIPEAIHQMIEEINQFGQGGLRIDNPKANGEDYLRELCHQKLGACRHRVIVFKAMMEKHHPTVPVRVLMNDIHAFSEMMIDCIWTRVELGGYPANIIVSNPPEPAEMLENMDKPGEEIDDAPSPSETAIFEEQLQTWQRQKTDSSSVTDYCQRIAQSLSVKKRLIELESLHDVHALQLSLQRYCKDNNHSFFYIHSPDDLVCQAPYIDQQTGQEMPGPGGPLYRFLTTKYSPLTAPILIINYANFDTDDLIRLNSLLDDHRSADGVDLPSNTLVIGLMNTKKPNCYQGEDFYSRFDVAETCPVPSTLLLQQLPELPPHHRIEDGIPKTIINLYHSSDWEERLLGYWAIDGDTFHYIKGEIEPALMAGHPIEIQNGPWDNEKFLLLWRQACILNTIPIADQSVALPATLIWHRSEGYDWPALRAIVTWRQGLMPGALILNPNSLNDFFTQYLYDDSNKTLSLQPGSIFQKDRGQTIHLNLTRTLSDDEWAMVLDTCLKQGLEVMLHLAPGISLSECITNLASEHEPAPSIIEWDGKSIASTMVIKSVDIDCTLVNLTSLNKDWQVIDISECEGPDLLTDIHLEQHKETRRRIFHRTEHALLTALQENQSVILKGAFSPTLTDALASLLLDRVESSTPNGVLILLSEQDIFTYLPTFSHTITAEKKRGALTAQFSNEELDRIPNATFEVSYSRLQARLIYRRIHPGVSSDEDAWQGLLTLRNTSNIEAFDPVNSEVLANEFIQKRLGAINRYLEHAPYVFLTGLTAVGKTSFVQRYIKNDRVELFQGEDSILTWARDQSNRQKILFIDEANLTHRQWSEFEGLFHHKPGILIGGHFYPLSLQHKVIFAGNPIQYGDERKLAPIFARHGNALVFEPMPMVFIYQQILKPVFGESRFAKNATDICLPILGVYRFLCDLSKEQLLISPRELHMMALLVYSFTYNQLSSLKESITAASHYAYLVGASLVPKSHRAAFDNQFMPTDALTRNVPHPVSNVPSNFLMTHSRAIIEELLDDLLLLRDVRQSEYIHSDTIRYGGLGGLILEGEPGCGKSEMVTACLDRNEYQLVIDFRDYPEKKLPEKHYYRMPAGMPIDEKKCLLLTAFQEGTIVVCDEINSSPMMEQFINALLLGKTPSGEPPRKPGFFIIGTQNPAFMAGRRQISLALARRLMTIDVQAYDHNDMRAILNHLGIPDKMANILVTAYEKTVRKAEIRQLGPRPVFRDLLKLARSYIGWSPMQIEETISNTTALVTQGLFSRKRANSTNEESEAKHLALSLCPATNYS